MSNRSLYNELKEGIQNLENNKRGRISLKSQSPLNSVQARAESDPRANPVAIVIDPQNQYTHLTVKVFQGLEPVCHFLKEMIADQRPGFIASHDLGDKPLPIEQWVLYGEKALNASIYIEEGVSDGRKVTEDEGASIVLKNRELESQKEEHFPVKTREGETLNEAIRDSLISIVIDKDQLIEDTTACLRLKVTDYESEVARRGTGLVSDMPSKETAEAIEGTAIFQWLCEKNVAAFELNVIEALSRSSKIFDIEDYVEFLATLDGIEIEINSLEQPGALSAKDSQERVESCVEHVRTLEEKYSFQSSDDSVREAVDESADLMGIDLSEQEAIAACEQIMAKKENIGD